MKKERSVNTQEKLKPESGDPTGGRFEPKGVGRGDTKLRQIRTAESADNLNKKEIDFNC